MPVLIVFLNNKLITCDAIVPVMAEVKRQYPAVAVEFVCTDARTEQAIRANIVLWDALLATGRFVQLGRTRTGVAAWLKHRLTAPFRLARYAALGLLGRASFLHFKALSFWPLKLLALIAPDRTCYVQSTTAGVTAIEQQVSDAISVRRHSPVVHAGGLLVGFTEDWPALIHPALKSRNRTMLAPPHTFTAWADHVNAGERRYFSSVLKSQDESAGRPIITYILSSMDNNGLLREPHLFSPLFEETLSVLAELGCTDPILIKPHPAMRPNYAAFIRETAARYPGLDIHFCDLHPTVLALQSRFVIGNCYSSTFAHFRAANVPCVEYTDYRPEILGITGGQSMRPDMVDHFINADRPGLAGVLRGLLARVPAARLTGRPAGFTAPFLAALGVAGRDSASATTLPSVRTNS